MQKFAKFATLGAAGMGVFAAFMIVWTYLVEEASLQQASDTIVAFALAIALYCVARLAFQSVKLEELEGADDEEDDEMEDLAAGL
jgi:hypothetical protein